MNVRRFNDAVIRNMVIAMKRAVTEPSPMMKIIEKEKDESNNISKSKTAKSSDDAADTEIDDISPSTEDEADEEISDDENTATI